MTWDEKKINPPGQWRILHRHGDRHCRFAHLQYLLYSSSSSSSRSDCLYMASVLLCYLHRQSHTATAQRPFPPASLEFSLFSISSIANPRYSS